MEEILLPLLADVDFLEEFDLLGIADARGEMDEPPPLPPPVITRKPGDVVRVRKSRYEVEIKIE